jgi:Cd2+/Zn2+-exporting ATPase
MTDQEPLVFVVEGMDCPDCAAKLEQGVASLPGVAEAHLSYTLARLEVTPAGSDPTIAIQRLASGMNYRVTPAGQSNGATAGDAGLGSWLWQRRRDLLTVICALLIGGAVLAGLAGAPEMVSTLLYGLAIAAGGFYVARGGLATLRATRSPDMNLLMTIAVVGAALIGAWEEGAAVVFLFSLGNALESYTMDRARGAIRKLMTLSPRVATRLAPCVDCQEHLGQSLPLGDSAVYEGGPCPWCDVHREQVPVDSLAVGDQILVRPGERLPMDGLVLSGQSAVDQSPITGESVPVEKAAGADVFAGSINGYGALTLRVTHLAADNTLSRIIRMVEEAQAQKAPSQRFVDVFARYYTPAVMVFAALVAVVPPLLGLGGVDVWVYRALVLLVIACPCALVISTPVTIVSALANAARNGVLIKGGAYLEAAGGLGAIAFDKTGTLTRGRPVVTDVVALTDGHAGAAAAQADVLRLAAAVESHSEHPLARAVITEAEARGVAFPSATDFVALPGQGAQAMVEGRQVSIGSHVLFDSWRNHGGAVCDRVAALEAEGKTVMIVGDAQGAWGLIAVADTLRSESADAVRALKAAGVAHTVMLTGDSPAVARAIGRAVGVDEVRAGLLPQDKVAAVDELLARYGTVGMVGDGVNDAPALARATVGIAMGAAGTDVALETADIALMSDDLSRLPYAIGLSRQARRVIQQNIGLSLAIKAVFLALALPGLATLWMAVFADMGASLIVTLNGMRLLRYRSPRGDG